MKQLILAVCVAFGLAQVCAAQTAATHSKLSPVTVHVLSNPGSTQTCFAHVNRCVVPVYVHAGDQTTNCSAWIDPAQINVPQPDHTNGTNQIKVIFVLKKGDANTNLKQFSFDVNYGIKPLQGEPADEFNSEHYDTADGNNSDPDDGTNASATSRRFRWASTHKTHVNSDGTYTGVRFTPTVLRINGSSVQTCDAGDPTITNTN